MSVVVARTSGFCWGVRRAVDMVLAEIKKGRGPFLVFGPLVHNPQVLGALEERGVGMSMDPSDAEGGTLFIRTHGITLEERASVERPGVSVRDLTCPRVGRALALARSRSREGYEVVILGDEGHQEVRAIRSYAGGEKAFVISGPGDAEDLPRLSKPFLMTQTTQDSEVFEAVLEVMRRRFPALEWESTICESTGMRQNELRRLLPKADCVVVVGGRESANTARLASIAREAGLPVFQVESQDELDPKTLKGFRKVVLTAGASTPSWVIRRVRGRLLELQGENVGRALGAVRTMVLGNFHVLPAAVAMGAASAVVVGNAAWMPAILSGALALFALQGLHTVLEAGFSPTPGEERRAFVVRRRNPLTISYFSALALSVVLSAFLPPLWGAFLAGAVGLFAAYSLPLLHSSGAPPSGVRSVPGSRDLLFSSSWALLVCIVPYLTLGGPAGPPAVAIWSLQLVLLLMGRSLLLDLVDLQGDAMLGRDTIPLTLGRRRSEALFWTCAALPVILVAFGFARGLLPAPGLGSFAGSLWLAAGYRLLIRNPFPSELSARLAADGSLFAAGIVPFLASIIFEARVF
ncbi:4-hydroxy-3-methylbut-2-enyl diphosphate reductase [Candidatus Fermentibacteria bacterium]|nr:4-hydroxy-3-methylbut-2-enyl diphosphate reductase [Candidatus Fermentibacteria bacterium]